MRRKKMASAKVKKTVLTLAEKMEKDFHDMPAKLAAQYDVELNTLKQQEKKLGLQLKKTQAEKKSFESKQSVLLKKKTTAATKKQVTAAKKAAEQAGKLMKNITVQLDQISKTCQEHVAKQSRFSQLSKQVSQLVKKLGKTPRKMVKARKKTATTIQMKEIVEAPVAVTSIETMHETVETN